MHSLLDRLWLFRGKFPAAPSNYIKLVRAVYRQRIYYIFGTIFKHVALLVTEISRQDQNFRSIPRTLHIYLQTIELCMPKRDINVF